MTNHVFRYENWSVHLSVMDSEGVTYEIRSNRTVASPCSDDGLFSRLVELGNLGCELNIDVRSLFETTCHMMDLN